MIALARKARATRGILIVASALVVAGVLQLAGANPATSQTATISARRVDSGPGLDPGASVWSRVPEVEIPLTAQQTSYPFQAGGVSAVKVSAVHDDERVYVRLEWDDRFNDSRADEVGRFSDAAAIQLPGDGGTSVPAICMGQADGGVNIWHWRADSQEGAAAVAQDIHGDAVTDLTLGDDAYPDDLEYPARRAGNVYSQPENGAVQNLQAVGFGTIGPLPEQPVEGQGEHDGRTWSVVFVRDLGAAGEGQPAFEEGSSADVAFAVWDGHNRDRNGQKSVSQLTRLELSSDGLSSDFNVLWLVALPVVFAAVGVFILRAGRGRGGAAAEAAEAAGDGGA